MTNILPPPMRYATRELLLGSHFLPTTVDAAVQPNPLPDEFIQHANSIRKNKYGKDYEQEEDLIDAVRSYRESHPDTDRVLEGTFRFKDDKLDFHCHTKNVSFAEVLKCITALRDECQRQIGNQVNCPHFK